MNEALEIVLLVLCLPCLCLGICLRPYRPQNRTEKPEVFLERRRNNAPPPLPLRDRALSLPLPAPKFNVPTTVQKTHSQIQAILFRQMPIEVRRLIYEEVLGGEVLHILRKRRKLGHYVCRVEPHLCLNRACLALTDSDGVWAGWRNHSEPTDGGLLPLLRTCRKV